MTTTTAPTTQSDTVATIEQPHVTYQLQYRKCGKPTCGCRDGQGHGPYWYAYFKVNGKLKSKYIGKVPPPESESE